MKSIRQQITLGIGLGFAMMLGSGGGVIYFSARNALLNQFDSGLRGKAVSMAALTKLEGNRVEFEFSENVTRRLSTSNVVEYYQLRMPDGRTLRRSRSLGTNNLPGEFGPSDDPRYFDLILPNGAKGRAIGIHFLPQHEHEPEHPQAGEESSSGTDPVLRLVVAADRAKLDQTLHSFAEIVLLTGGLTLLATGLVIGVLLRRCLAPLNRVAEQASQIHAGSLGTRFPTNDMPAELDPICHRMNDLLARVESSFNEMNEYAAKVTHELRTPLAILRLKIEQAGGRIAPELAEDLQAELHRLTHVVEQSLLMAKAEQGRLVLQPYVFDLARLVEDVAEDFSLLAQEEGRTVRLASPSTANVVADPKYLRQIIHNLFTNALRHGQGDIQVGLSASEGQCSLIIRNPVRSQPVSSSETLGLGLRVVDTLLHLQPEIQCERQPGPDFYLVKLTFAAAPASSASILPAASRAN